MRAALFAILLVGCDGDLRFDAKGADASSDTRAPIVECTRDEECPTDGRRRCDVASQRCVECGVTADCDSDEICEPTTKQCMHTCGDGATCESEAPFCDPRGICVCTATSCTAGDRNICAPSGRCVECTSDAQCSEVGHRCDLTRGACVE